jgi:hypothetical protein
MIALYLDSLPEIILAQRPQEKWLSTAAEGLKNRDRRATKDSG